MKLFLQFNTSFIFVYKISHIKFRVPIIQFLHNDWSISDHALYNLLNELRKREKMNGPSSILSFLFATSLKHSMLQKYKCFIVYQMTLNYIKIAFLVWKRRDFVIFSHSYNQSRCVTFLNLFKPLVVYLFYCMALSHSQTRHHLRSKLQS